MGCDIHLYVEIRNQEVWTCPFCKGQNWTSSLKCEHCSGTRPEGITSSKEWAFHNWEQKYQDGTYDDGYPKYDWHRMFESPLYVGRNYNLFAMLANVRNGYGFAGCDTGNGFKPIHMPKGIPSDVSKEILEKYGIVVSDEDDEYSCSKETAQRWIGYGSVWLNGEHTFIGNPDWHSASWFTVQELLDYDLEQTTKQRGVVGKKQFEVFLKEGKPQSYSSDSFGASIKHVSNEEMEQLLDVDCDFSPVTRVEWGESYHDCARKFWDVTVPELQKLGNPNDVRIVFWFDN